MQAYLYVMGGGAIGAALRFALSRALPGATSGAGVAWPWATFVANIAGCLAMGLLAAALWRGGAPVDGPWRWALGVGLLGGFTTFSAFSLETVRLVEGGAVGMAIGYAVLSVMLSVGATAAGLALGRMWGAA